MHVLFNFRHLGNQVSLMTSPFSIKGSDQCKKEVGEIVVLGRGRVPMQNKCAQREEGEKYAQAKLNTPRPN